MKKICVLLALVLVLAGIPAFAAEGDAILGLSNENTLSFSYCFSIADTLYLVSYGTLYTYRVGDSDLKEYTLEIPQSLISDDGSFDVATLPFGANGKLYSLNLITAFDETTEFKSAGITELTLQDDGVAKPTLVCEVDWSDMVEFYDNNSYPVQPDVIFGMGGYAYARYYDNLGDYRTLSIDLASGATQQIDDLMGAYTMAPYKDDTLLVEMYDTETDTSAKLMAYNPADGSMKQLTEIPIDNYTPLLGLAYDPSTDNVYCVKTGEIVSIDLQAGTLSDGLTDMPVEAYSASPACILDGGYYAYAGEGAAVRNLDPAQKAQSKLKINDSFWNDSINSAYYRFANAHGDVSVVLSREYTEVENLIENMMNRDDRIDAYVLTTSSSVFEALYNRGYLMELDGNEKIKALADGMYPTLREKLSTNGHLVALPLSTYGWSMGVNGKVLEKLGMKVEDVPNTWSGFLDFLAGLQGKLTEENGLHLVYSGYNASDLRYELLNMIMMDYQYYANAANADTSYESPMLRELLEKLEKIDFTALGLSDEEEDQAVMLDAYDDESILLQTTTGCNIGNFYGLFTPVLMKITEDEPAFVVLETNVLVLNPFSKNAEAALAFAGEVVDNLSVQTRYSISPDLNDPIRGQQNQAALDEIKSDLDALRSEYETAAADEKQSYEEDIKDMESTYAYAEENNWDISPKELDWYRSHDDNIITSIYNWLYPDTSTESDDSAIGQTAEAEELIDQYLSGQITLDDMLAGINRKVQMRRLEGN